MAYTNRAEETNVFIRGVELDSRTPCSVFFCLFFPWTFLVPLPRLRTDRSLRYNPLAPVVWLSFGIVTALIAVIWIIHMVLYMIVQPSVTPFLNDYFLWFDKWFPLFGVLSVAVFSLYLLAACVKGCFKFGLRLVWFTLHPMKPNGTYMNSFLFNCG